MTRPVTLDQPPPRPTGAAGNRAADGCLSRVVFLFQIPPDERDYERLGLRHMADAGIEVTALDLTNLINPVLACDSSPADRFPRVTVRVVSTIEELEREHHTLAEADFVVCCLAFDGSRGALKVYRSLAKAGTPYLVIASNVYPGYRQRGPSPRDKRSAGERVAEIRTRFRMGLIRPLNSLRIRLPHRWLGVTPPALIVHGGRDSQGNAGMFPVDESTRRVFIHAMDYEICRSVRSDGFQQTDTAVLIDENVGFHRDLVADGDAQLDTAEEFYPKLRLLLDRIERELNLEVVIAGNPRADHETRRELFGSRRIEYHATARLIAESRLVLAHRSTAIGLAVMFRRPVMLIATRNMYDHWTQRPVMNAFSDALGKKIQIFDDPISVDLDEALMLDDAEYDRYMESHIKVPGTQDSPYWDVAIGEMERVVASDNSRSESSVLVEAIK